MYNRERIVSPIKGIGNNKKYQFKWIENLNLWPQSVKILKENIGDNLDIIR